MILTSTQYQTAIKGDTRETRTLMLCQFNPKVYYPLGTATATSEYDAAHAVTQLIDGRIRATDYKSYGPGLPLQLQPVHAGWWSSATSDGTGAITPQVITIDYRQEIRSKNFFVVGLATNYPVAFTIELSSDALTWTTLATVTANAEALYSLVKPAYKVFRYLRLTVSKISALSAQAKILQAGAVTTVAFEFWDNDTMKLVEEMRQYNASPLSGLVSSFVECSVNNEDGLTDDDNTSSFFCGLLGKNFTFRPWCGPLVTTSGTDEYEFIPLGVFYSNGAEQDTDDITSKFLGYDKMSRIKDLSPPIMTVAWDTTVYELFKLFFDGLGLDIGTEYIIDKALTQPVAAGFFAGEMGSNFSGETVGEALQVMAEAGCAYVRCDRFGRIVVRSNFLTGTVDATIQDSDYVFKVVREKDPALHFDQVNVRYRDVVGLEDESELYRADLDIPLGGGPAIDIEFPDPVGLITRVALTATNAEIDAIYPGAASMQVTLTNTGASETGTLVVYGKKLKFFNTHIEKTDLMASEEDPKKILSISNWLIQDRETALSYGDTVLRYTDEPFSHYAITERGDPSREIGDHIRLNDVTHDIDKNLQITRRTLEWRGILSGETECRVALANWKWARVAPPHLIQCTITKEKIVTSSWVGPGLLIDKEMN